ncbi:Cytochrome c oxidase assembly protein cox19, partial [Coemansia sp. RSA 2706]
MSFAGPPKISVKPTPPDRGSFPLDHGGECKHAMVQYLTCLESCRGSNERCRKLSKKYLECRMQ